MRIVVICSLLSTALGVAPLAGAQAAAPPARDFRTSTVVAVKNGPNQLDIDGDGRTDLVVAAWRENFNAHGFTLVTFYRLTTDEPPWQLVPFFDSNDKPSMTSFTTNEGADCRLRDLRIVRPGLTSTSAAAIIVADRAFGQSYASPATVTFTVYRAVRNADHELGAPAFYFREADTFTSTGVYCDVGEAFEKELGIR